MGYKGCTVTLPPRTLFLLDWGGGLNWEDWVGRLGMMLASPMQSIQTKILAFWVWGPNLAMLMAYCLTVSSGVTLVGPWAPYVMMQGMDGPRSFSKSKSLPAVPSPPTSEGVHLGAVLPHFSGMHRLLPNAQRVWRKLPSRPKYQLKWDGLSGMGRRTS